MNNKITLLITLALWGVILIIACNTESDKKHVETSFELLKKNFDILTRDSISIGGDSIVDLVMVSFPENDPLIVLYDRKIPQDIFFISQKNFHPSYYYDDIEHRYVNPLLYRGKSPYKSWTHFELDRYLNQKFAASGVPEKMFSELTEKICRFSGQPFVPISNHDSLMAILADTTSYLSALNKQGIEEKEDLKKALQLLARHLKSQNELTYLKIYKFKHSIRVFDLRTHFFLSSSINSFYDRDVSHLLKEGLYHRVYYDYTEFVLRLNRTWR